MIFAFGVVGVKPRNRGKMHTTFLRTNGTALIDWTISTTIEQRTVLVKLSEVKLHQIPLELLHGIVRLFAEKLTIAIRFYCSLFVFLICSI